jgi:hypothetical protein
MPHPFFDSGSFPWRRPDARVLKEQLRTLITNVPEIVAIYERSGGDRAALNSNAAPDDVWQNALNLLAGAGLFRNFIDELSTIARLRTNSTFQAALLAVREANPEDQDAIGESRHDQTKPWFEDLPLDFSREETRNAERLLVVGYSSNMAALSLADSAGLDVTEMDQTAPVKFLVQDILVKARLANRLMPLLMKVLGDPDRAAIHPEIRLIIAAPAHPSAQPQVSGDHAAPESEPLDPDGARSWYREEADAGSMDAMNKLGLVLENQQRPDRDGARAWYLKAAAAGNSDAMNNLGWMLQNQDPPDLESARNWYQKAAAVGNGEAMTNLG